MVSSWLSERFAILPHSAALRRTAVEPAVDSPKSSCARARSVGESPGVVTALVQGTGATSTSRFPVGANFRQNRGAVTVEFWRIVVVDPVYAVDVQRAGHRE